jgi:hypothetical protein
MDKRVLLYFGKFIPVKGPAHHKFGLSVRTVKPNLQLYTLLKTLVARQGTSSNTMTRMVLAEKCLIKNESTIFWFQIKITEYLIKKYLLLNQVI